jgi:uncharacterized membrane protein
LATLIALVHQDVATAEESMASAKSLEHAGNLDIFDLSLVTKDENGRIEYHSGRHSVRAGAIGGAILGGLTGLIFAVPVVGLVTGAVGGAFLGELDAIFESGGFEEFRDQVSNDLQKVARRSSSWVKQKIETTSYMNSDVTAAQFDHGTCPITSLPLCRPRSTEFLPLRTTSNEVPLRDSLDQVWRVFQIHLKKT